MGVADDGGALRLAEDLPQEDGLHPSGADEVREDVAGAHGGELVGVPHHHKAGAGAQGTQQRREEGQVHHAHLVHDDGVGLQGLLLALGEGHLMGGLVPAHAE